jgi:diadenosine tetraphosphate (Ap4A) HIT family hydrolase
MNQTFEKFGWPGTRIAELEHWGVMLRPHQPVLGALVLACKQPVRAFGEVDAAGMAELGRAAAGIEAMLARAIGHEKINYIMLMMVDPDVHFHVLPRYPGEREAAGVSLPDPGWPGPPDLAAGRALTQEEQARLTSHLAGFWTG